MGNLNFGVRACQSSRMLSRIQEGMSNFMDQKPRQSGSKHFLGLQRNPQTKNKPEPSALTSRHYLLDLNARVGLGLDGVCWLRV